MVSRKILERLTSVRSGCRIVATKSLSLRLLDTVLEGISDKRAQYLANQFDMPLEQVLDLAQYDVSGKHVSWIINQFRQGNLRFPEDGDKVKKTFLKFSKLKSNPSFVKRDISQYPSYGSLAKAVNEFDVETKGETKRTAISSGVKQLIKQGIFAAFEVTTAEAASKLFRHTEWCVKDPKYFAQYEPPRFYYIEKSNKPFALIHPESDQITDKYDGPIDDDIEAMDDIAELLAPVGGPVSKMLTELVINNKVISDHKRLTSEEWKHILDSPKLSIAYAISVKKRVPELEKAIASNHKYAYQYAKKIVKGRWPEGEKAIASDPRLVYKYAKNIIKGRWPEGEKTVASNSEYAYYYARDVIKGRWPEGEKAIASNPEYAYYYAIDIIKGRWPEAEKVIASNFAMAYYYAKKIVKGRWPEGEKAIVSDPKYAYEYAKDVIEGRWPEGEKAIASDPESAYNYARYVINGRWPEGEKAIFSDRNTTKKYTKPGLKMPALIET